MGLETGSSKQFGCTNVEAGWARAPLSNKSAGILIALRKPFTSEHIHQTWTPPPSLQGRGGYQRTVERLLERLDGCLSEQKHRTTPVVLMMPTMELGWSSVLADIIRSAVSALQQQAHVADTWRASV